MGVNREGPPVSPGHQAWYTPTAHPLPAFAVIRTLYIKLHFGRPRRDCALSALTLPEATSPTSRNRPCTKRTSPGRQRRPVCCLQGGGFQTGEGPWPAGGREADRQAGLARSPAHLPAPRGPQSPGGRCPWPGPASIYLAPGEALSSGLLSEVPQGGRGGCSECWTPVPPSGGEIRLRVWPGDPAAGGGSSLWGRMLYQLGEDSVHMKQPLASQTSFQTGTCHPVAAALT